MNDSETLPMNTFLGGGATAFNLVPGRPDDTFGLGVSYSWLNPNLFLRDHELMLQGYYQAKVIDNLYVQPVLTYINEPGASPDLDDAWAFTFRATFLF